MKTEELALITENDLWSKIYIVRGVQVMLDFDLAAIYGYETRYFNRQVSNNLNRFDEDFRFQLTREEFANLMCKNFTSSWGGTRELPYAFTEEGIYMLMTVLNGDLAVSQSKKLIRLFKKNSFSIAAVLQKTVANGSPPSHKSRMQCYTKTSSQV